MYGAPPAAPPPPPPPNLLGEEAALRQAIEEIAESYRDGGGGDGDPVELPSEALSDTVRDAEQFGLTSSAMQRPARDADLVGSARRRLRRIAISFPDSHHPLDRT